MNKPDFDSIYEDLKNEYYNSFVNEYLEFETEYDIKEKAVEDFRRLVNPILHKYCDLVVNNTNYFDQFKKRLEQKMNDSFERFKNPVNKMIEHELPKIMIDFKKQKELELSNDRIIPSFDYHYFDHFMETDSVELIAKIKAHEKFHDYLDNRNSGFRNQDQVPDIQIPVLGKMPKISNEPIYLDDSYLKSFLKDLYFVLKDKYSLINTEYEDFLNHFIPYDNYIMIIWNGTEVEIAYLFNFLKPKTKRIYKLITKHFFNNKGEYFDNKQLSSVYTRKPPTARIEAVIEELTKFKISK